MRIRCIWMRVFLPALMLVAVFAGQAESAEAPEVFYDKATDRLSVKAEKVSLKGVLARIALLSGAEFLIDPAVEQPVSITLKDMPLEKGLKRIVKSLDLSYAMMYQKKEGQDEAAEPLLITMKIVPKGMKNPNLVPVVNVKGEAVIRSFKRRPGRKGQTLPSIFDYAEKRWQARLDNMPEEKRKQIEEDIKQRQEEQAARMEEKEQRKAEREERRAEHQARRQAAEEELKESNPELYELRQQQKEEIRQKATDELRQ
ncbi:hypothetical protein BMS3Abin10_01129 [bacterium BMS3Abin10]|nr:hypothetical protein BMS3Abin10_01129 [bacterium BMS3Abin10]